MPKSLLDETIERLLQKSPEEQRRIVDEANRATEGMKWVPSPGPQTDAYLSKADILLYGGEPGGGKTSLICGLAYNCHDRSLIMRRQYTDLSAVIDDVLKIHGNRDGFNGSPPPSLKFDGKLIDFGAAARIGDEQHWQGNPHDFIGLDEGTQFAYQQVRFLMGWLRSVKPGQRKRVVIATNPPLTVDGLWINEMFAPWLDDKHPRPARAGELRWYITDESGKDIEVDGPDPVLVGQKMVQPISRTFIPASVRDNPFLANTGYEAQLDSMIEPFRSILMGGFKTTFKDAPNQVIPTAWVRAAMDRWRSKPPEGVPMCSIGVDCSGGGDDQMVMAIRHDGWFAPLIKVEGKEMPKDRLGSYAAGIVISHRRDKALVVVDMGGGYGGSLLEHLDANDVETSAYKGAEGTMKRTSDKKLGFTNVRSAAYWTFREALDPGQPGGSPISLPDDPRLIAGLCAPTFQVTPRGIQVEPKSKQESGKKGVVERLGFSPDEADAVIMSWWGGPRQSTHALDWQEQRIQHSKRGQTPAVVMGRHHRR